MSPGVGGKAPATPSSPLPLPSHSLSAGSRGIPARAPTPTSASRSLKTQRSRGVHARPCGRNAANQGWSGHAPRLPGAGSRTGPQPLANFKGRTRQPRAPPRGDITPCTALSLTPPRLLVRNLRGRRGRGLSSCLAAEQRVNIFRRPHLPPPGHPPRSPLPPPPHHLPGEAEQRRASRGQRITREPGAPARRRRELGIGALSLPSPHTAVRHAEEENK